MDYSCFLKLLMTFVVKVSKLELFNRIICFIYDRVYNIDSSKM